jgi:hypothetical protein
MTILNNLLKMRAAVNAQIAQGNSPLAIALNNAAVAALLGGISGDEFKSYMAVFADNPQQLERLTVIKKDAQGNIIEPAYVSQMRAYVVSNSICDPQTSSFLNNRIDFKIDGDANNPQDPPVDATPSDPGGAIVARRPAGLKSIPTVIVQP